MEKYRSRRSKRNSDWAWQDLNSEAISSNLLHLFQRYFFFFFSIKYFLLPFILLFCRLLQSSSLFLPHILTSTVWNVTFSGFIEPWSFYQSMWHIKKKWKTHTDKYSYWNNSNCRFHRRNRSKWMELYWKRGGKSGGKKPLQFNQWIVKQKQSEKWRILCKSEADALNRMYISKEINDFIVCHTKLYMSQQRQKRWKRQFVVSI